MKSILFIILSLSFISLNSCMSSKIISGNGPLKHGNPPGGILISENFYCDRTEVMNFHWMEYMFWTKRTYGSESAEFLNTLPDTLVWVEPDSCTTKFVDFYLRHPATRSHPLVGISQQQAKDYSKWRSDRVFEYMLIHDEVIAYNEFQNRENVFTIENFFNNKIERLNSDREIIYYPEFRLPTISERNLILKYSDSLDSLHSDKYYSKHPKSRDIELIYCDKIPCLNDTTWTEPTRPVRSYYSRKRINPFYDLRGNVSEWAAETNIVFGGSWGDDCSTIMKTDTAVSSTASKYIGFRNVCEFKKWGE